MWGGLPAGETGCWAALAQREADSLENIGCTHPGEVDGRHISDPPLEEWQKEKETPHDQ